jgi:hypothetical protein
MTDSNELDLRVKAIKQLLEAFKYERITYLAITFLSLLVLLACAIFMFTSGESEQQKFAIGLIASSGGIIFTASKVLKMWNDALKILSPIISKEKGNE